MTRRLLTKSKIYFANAHVVRLDYTSSPELDKCRAEHKKVCKNIYTLIKGTWGFSDVTVEWVRVRFNYPEQRGHNDYRDMSQDAVIASLLEPDWIPVPRAYICFSQEEDMLQFRLSTAITCQPVSMWPDTVLFTIHEYT